MVRNARRLILGGVIAVVSLVVLVAAALIVATLAIDANRLKPRIAAEFERRTGRELVLDGNLSWRFFPWLVIRSASGSIGNPPGFAGDGRFASWRNLRLGVELLPLFDREVIIDRVQIDGLDLTLDRAGDGRGNWSLPSPEVVDAANASAPPPPEAGSPVQTLRFAVARVELDDARIAWRDAASRQAWEAQGLALRLSIPAGATVRDFDLRDISLKGRFGGTGLPRIVDVVFESQAISVDGEPLAVHVPGWKGAFAGAALEGGFDVDLSGEQPQVDGRFAGRVESLREVLRAVGLELPATRDRDVFGNVELETQFAFDGNRLTTESLNVRVDDTRVRGRLDRPFASDGVLHFALIADRIDVDRYLDPPDAKSEPFELKLAPLRALKAEGELRIDEARLGGALMRGMTVNLE